MKVFRVGRRRRRMALLAGVIAAVVLVSLALPASAHSRSITGDTVCYNGDHIVTWHIKNSSVSDQPADDDRLGRRARRRDVVPGDRLHLAGRQRRHD